MGGEDQKKEAIDLKDVENGPVTQANRQCRDMFCCILFLVAIGGMVYLTIYGYTMGNTNLIYRGVDASGNVCGYPGGVASGYPYLYFYNPTVDITLRACVDVCPAIASGGTTPSQSNCYGLTCSWTYYFSSSGVMTNAGTGLPGTPSSSDYVGYDSTSALSRVCIPSTSVFSSSSFTTALQSSFSSAVSQGDLASFIEDIKNNWKWLLAAFGFVILVSFIFMWTLRCLAGCIVWVSLIGILFVLGGLGIIFLYNGGVISGSTASSAANYLGVPVITNTYDSTIGWVFIGIAGAFLIVILCCCSRIRLAVAVCKSAGQFVVGVCLIVLVPIFQTLIAIGLWGGCLVVMVYLVSAANYVVISGNYFTSISNYGDTALIRFYCFIFGTLWCNAFVQAMGTFVIASACCMWYYSHGPGQELSLPILRSYKMVFRYHFGSLAFGSLILAIVQFLQIVVELFKKQAEQSGAANTKCFEYVINCLRCCLACVERIVQFINKTAYIQIALRGKSFCNAAKDGFELVWSNAMRYAIVAGVGEVIMFLGKIMIATLTTVGYYCLITYVPSIKSGFLAPIYSLILVFVMAYAVAVFFMAVYSLAMDTLLQCFIVDETNQKGKGGKAPLYAPEDLAELIDRD